VLEILAGVVLGAVLAYSAAVKVVRPREAIAAMGTYGFGGGGRVVAWAIALVAEAALAVAVIAGSERGAPYAAGLMLLFAATMASAVMRGAVGAPCGCFGPDSRIGWPAVARALVLAVGFAALAAAL
jgi:hypothetical protein